MPCGCQNTCGCTVVGGAGISVRIIGNAIHVGLSGNLVSETFAADGVIASTTDIALFDGAPGSTLELPPALAGSHVEVWNLDEDDNVTVAAASGETVNTLPSVDVTARYVGRFISIVTGEWLAHES